MDASERRTIVEARRLHAEARACFPGMYPQPWDELPAEDTAMWLEAACTELAKRRDLAAEEAESRHEQERQTRINAGEAAYDLPEWDELDDTDRESYMDDARSRLAVVHGRWPYVDGIPALLDPPPADRHFYPTNDGGAPIDVETLGGTLSVYRCPKCLSRLGRSGICLNACHLGRGGQERFSHAMAGLAAKFRREAGE